MPIETLELGRVALGFEGISLSLTSRCQSVIHFQMDHKEKERKKKCRNVLEMKVRLH